MRELVMRAQAGEEAAFEEIVILTLPGLYRLAAVMVRPADAPDATQEALLQAWRQIARLRDPARFDAWLHRILVNRCLNVMRAARRRPIAATRHNSWTGSAAAEPAGSDTSAAVADRDVLDRAFQRLRPDERAILALHYVADLSLPDVAERVGIPLGTAKSRLHRALAALRAALEEV